MLPWWMVAPAWAAANALAVSAPCEYPTATLTPRFASRVLIANPTLGTAGDERDLTFHAGHNGASSFLPGTYRGRERSRTSTSLPAEVVGKLDRLTIFKL